jgi:hypothetical protein
MHCYRSRHECEHKKIMIASNKVLAGWTCIERRSDQLSQHFVKRGRISASERVKHDAGIFSGEVGL